ITHWRTFPSGPTCGSAAQVPLGKRTCSAATGLATGTAEAAGVAVAARGEARAPGIPDLIGWLLANILFALAIALGMALDARSGAKVGEHNPHKRSENAMGLLDSPFDPAGETALVTGAGNGIGRAIAQALVDEGVRTVFADISKERVAAAIKASPKPELAVPFVGDLAERATCDALLAHAEKTIGRVTHFVHSASPP